MHLWQVGNKNSLNILNLNIKKNMMIKIIKQEMLMAMLLFLKKEYSQIIWRKVMAIQLLDICLVIILTKAIQRMIKEILILIKDLFIKPKFQNHLKILILPQLLLMTTHYSTRASPTTQWKMMKYIEVSHQGEIGNIITPIKKAIMEHSKLSLNISTKERRRNSQSEKNQFGCKNVY